MKPISARVVVHNLGDHQAEFQKKLGAWFSLTKKGAYEFRSLLEPTEEINTHLIWLFGILDTERAFLRKLTQNGIEVVCQCRAHKSSSVLLKSKALAMAHLMGISLEIL